MLNKKLIMVLCLVLLAGNYLTAQNKYIGAGKCKMCHNSAAKGAQYDKWLSTSHTKAFTVLSSEASLAYAKANGIADPTTDSKCIKCHSTAASVDASLVDATLTKEEGVSCESCHGPGSTYKSMAIMKVQADALANGLIVPDKATCEKCHTKEGNPFYKPFNYDSAIVKVSHKNPTK
ncbi:MAG: cytochrome c family protein [Bacteroidota bacterium]